MIVIKIIYSLLWTTPVIFMVYITVHANNAKADSWLVISLASIAVLAAMISAIKISEIWVRS